MNNCFQEIQDGHPPYIIAEIGSNHNGDMNLAKKMIVSAKECGCNAVKFQSWDNKSLICEEEYQKNIKYNDSPKKHFGSLREMVEKYYLRPEQHNELKQFCDEIKIEFASTPFSNKEVNLLNDLGVRYFKLASMDINNISLIEYMASFQKPILLSTGMATLGEIEHAVNTIEAAGNKNIILLHCIAIYPPEYKDINLNNIKMLKKAFGYPVGFSDHSIGASIPLAAVALGACVIEKHFTIDKDLPGWDHEISANPKEMKTICEEAKNISDSLGSFKRIVSTAELEKRKKFRRSIVITRDLRVGEVIEEGDITFKRPGTNISPTESKYVVGRTLLKDVRIDEVLTWDALK